MRDMKKVIVMPVVIGALGAASKEISKWIEKIGINLRDGHVQKTALLGTARILSVRNLKKIDIDFDFGLLQLAFKA